MGIIVNYKQVAIKVPFPAWPTDSLLFLSLRPRFPRAHSFPCLFTFIRLQTFGVRYTCLEGCMSDPLRHRKKTGKFSKPEFYACIFQFVYEPGPDFRKLTSFELVPLIIITKILFLSCLYKQSTWFDCFSITLWCDWKKKRLQLWITNYRRPQYWLLHSHLLMNDIDTDHNYCFIPTNQQETGWSSSLTWK